MTTTTLHAIFTLPAVFGIKVATLDSVMTFQRIAAVMREHPDKLLITGEDRFLGYSLMMGARSALIGMGAALIELQASLLRSFASGDDRAFLRLFCAAGCVQPGDVPRSRGRLHPTHAVGRSPRRA